VWRIVSRIGTNAMLDGTLNRELACEHDRERVLEKPAHNMRSTSEPADAR
jgi:hypothetical protein